MPTLSWRVKKYLTLQLERFRRWKALATSTKAADKRLADELRSTENSPAMLDAKRMQEPAPQGFSWAKMPIAGRVLLLLFAYIALVPLLSDEEERSPSTARSPSPESSFEALRATRSSMRRKR
jgi:hypothetical protein